MPTPPAAESAHGPRFDLDPHAISPNLVGAAVATAVDTDVRSHQDAHLIHDTRVVSVSPRQAAQRHGLGYEAAKKRRQRAEARWVAWWLPDAARTSPRAEGRGAA
jgi:hypothetical protein